MNTSDVTNNARKRPVRKAFAISAIVLGSIAALVVVVLAAATLYMSTSGFRNRLCSRASEYFDANINVDKIQFTLWSTFPHFCLHLDSVDIVSRKLVGLPADVRRRLPQNCDSLASFSHLKGNVNVLKLIAGDIVLRDVEIEGLKVNIVEVNDSLANYDIVPKDDVRHMKIPRFTVNSVKLPHIACINYFSLPVGLDAFASDIDAELLRDKGSDDDYRLSLGGFLNATLGGAKIFKQLPCKLNGNVALNFQPFAVRLSDFSFDFASLLGKLDMKLTLSRNVSIDNFDCNLNSFDLLALYQYVASEYFPKFESLVSNVSMQTSMHMTEPFVASADSKSPGFDFAVENLHVTGQDMDFTLSGRIIQVPTDPEVEARLKGIVNLELLRRIIPGFPSDVCEGLADADLLVKFRVADLTSDRLRNVLVDGSLLFPDLKIKIPGKNMDIHGTNASFRFNGHLADVNESAFGYADLDLDADIAKVVADAPGLNASLSGVTITADAKENNGSSFSHVAMAPLLVKLDAAQASVDYAPSDLHINASHFTADGSLTPPEAGNQVALDLDIGTGKTDMAIGNNKISYASLATSLTATPAKIVMRKAPAGTPADKRMLDYAAHTPAYINFIAPKDITGLLDSWKARLDVDLAGAHFSPVAYPADNVVERFKASVRPDSVAVQSLRLRSQSNGLDLRGYVSNIRGFLADTKAQNLRIDLGLNFDTINFNQIATTLDRGKRMRGVSTEVPAQAPPLTASDTVALLIPRNIQAHLSASAKETIYTNLHLFDLFADMNVAQGVATLDTVGLSASFGKAGASVVYDTSDIEHMKMALDVSAYDIDVTGFFNNFNSLLEMMPQMKNLSGLVSLNMAGNFDIWPTMMVNVPSLQARITAEGRKLLVHQTRFIRHVTKMMMIPYDGDLHIDNIDVRADVHDNLLQLYPFDVAFSKYRIEMLGSNDFDGNLYYHIGVLETPFHFGFGVNVLGNFSHPKLRFGGKGYHPQQNLGTMQIYRADTINIPREAKYYLDRFMANAVQH